MHEIGERIKKINDADEVLKTLIELLEYDTSSCFRYTQDNTDYDAEYAIEIENKKYTLIGVKVLRSYDENEISAQHLKYWNRNDVPFSIFALPNEIRIYNNFTIGTQKLLYKTGNKKESIVDLFTESSITRGLLWERMASIAQKSDRVDKYLLENLRNTLLILNRSYGMELEAAYSFLAQCIFIRYLEDRGMLTETAFIKYGVKDFDGLLCLEDEKCLQDFFAELKCWLNGDLFDLDAVVWPSKMQTRIIRDFFAAEEINKDGTVQLTFLKYDFSKIPIELISNIYETFFNLEDTLKNKKEASQNGAFYTPYYLADFMNDRCLERHALENMPVILDPACGSGVFLVGAFKRLAEKIYREKGAVSPAELTHILLNNIYGVDKNVKALKLACFSLYVALLEFLTPKDILENRFKFPGLIGRTLFEKNFFDGDLDKTGIRADIIIGNPPWLSDKDKMHYEYCKRRNIPISDRQIAQAFVARAADFAYDDTIISLIVTNGIFINENAEEFRKYILQNYRLLEVFNLYGIKQGLFSHAKAPCSILVYKCRNKEKDYKFDYFAFKPNMIAAVFQKIVYDTENIIKIKNTYIKKNPYVWRVLQNGDEYDVRVIGKMRMFPPVSERGYCYLRGYAVGSKDLKPRPEFLKYKGGNLQEGFAPYLINYEAIPKMKVAEFERPRENTEGYFCGCKLLIKRTQNERLSGAAFCVEPLIFCDDFHCLYDPCGEKAEDLKVLEAIINSGLFRYYRFFASKEQISIKAEISKGDILNFPVPAKITGDDKERLLKVISEIEGLLGKRYKEQIFEDLEIEQKIKKHEKEIDDIVYNLYNLDEIERAAVQYALDYIISKSDSGEGAIGQPEQDRVYSDYAEYMERYFGNYLSGGGLRLQRTEVISQNLFTLICFSVTGLDGSYESNDINMLKNIVDILGLSSIGNIDSELLIKKRLSGFLKNGFFVIKPKEAVNWTVMSAVKDADHFAKIILSGEEHYGQ